MRTGQVGDYQIILFSNGQCMKSPVVGATEREMKDLVRIVFRGRIKRVYELNGRNGVRVTVKHICHITHTVTTAMSVTICNKSLRQAWIDLDKAIRKCLPH